MKKVVLATSNKNKLREIREILQGLEIEILCMDDVGLENLEIIEDGLTFEENSLKKASVVMEKTGLSAIADDSGLEVDALNGRPGVYSARFAGENSGDKENNRLLLKMLQETEWSRRTARFVSVITLLHPDGESHVVRGTVEGIIAHEEAGENGFGYDPLFYYVEEKCTFAQLSAEKKNQISHRAKALTALRGLLEQRRKNESSSDQ